MDAHVGMLAQELRDLPGLVCRKIVGNNMNPLAFRLVRGDIAQEGHELCRGVSWRRFAQHLTRLGIESGVQRQSAMAASQPRRRPQSTYGYSGVWPDQDRGAKR